MAHSFKTILVTGGSGFIGSAFLLRFVPKNPNVRFVNLDALTYAGNPFSLREIESSANYAFEHVDLRDSAKVDAAFEKHQPDAVVHFAAESHVDRSVHGPRDFIETNIMGTFNLLEACRAFWKPFEGKRFHHVSTDEVYGSLGETGQFTETTGYDPHSPYSASKASSDHLVRAYYDTYGLPITLTNCSNNYGPRQFPEKLIPLMTLNALEGKPLPVYGKGLNVRDWLHVDDHCDAIWTVLTEAQTGETYNVGGNSERRNIDVLDAILNAVSSQAGKGLEDLKGQITYVADRPGHDWRYAIDASKIKRDLGWEPKHTFQEGIEETVAWYVANEEWIAKVRSGEYRTWIEKNYAARS